LEAVVTRDLCKSYGAREVLHRLNLCVPAGTLFGFLGPNGAGKTTVIRILLGLLRASAGAARVLGHDVWRDSPRLHAEVGYLPGDVRLYDHLTGRATLAFLDGVRGARAGAEIRRLARELDLDLDRRVRAYSRGMKQKLGLIQALMHRPRLLLLDEPTVGLDPLMRQALYAELRRGVSEGRTVLLSSHTLSEVEALCDHVAIVRDGHLVEQERIETLRRRALRHVEIRFDSGRPRSPTIPAGLRVIHEADDHLTATWAGPVGPLLSWLAGAPVQDVTIGDPDLEDLFLAYYAATPVESST
jgi:ABC-2 type transport system ATP-binding protein